MDIQKTFYKNLETLLENVPELIKPLVPGSIALQTRKLFNQEYLSQFKKSKNKDSIIDSKKILFGIDNYSYLFIISIWVRRKRNCAS